MRSALFILAVCFAAAAAFADTSQADAAAAQKLYVNKCARCHKLYDPTKYTDDVWDVWMLKMKRKAHLSDQDYETLKTYLRDVREKAGAAKSGKVHD